MNTNYTTLLVSSSKDIASDFENLSQEIDLNYHALPSITEALEFLMDHSVESILLDCIEDEQKAIEFLEYLSSDFENQSTPIIAIVKLEQFASLSKKLLPFNVISITTQASIGLQVKNLLCFLKTQSYNVRSLKQNLAESEDRSVIDQLTKAFNRYGCEDIFQALTSRVKAYNEPFSVVMLDIDHFKRVNDTYGHDVGDEILISFAKTIEQSIRRDDSLVRLGGEEFLVFLSNADLETAKIVASHLRQKIKEKTHSSKNIAITSSFGVAAYKNNEEFEQLNKRVDELLYKAKDAGRDIVISEDTTL